MPADIENEVKSLTKWLQSFEYIVLATIWYKVLSAINGVSCILQRSSLTLDEESKVLVALIDDLQKIRSSWSSLLQESELVAANLNVAKILSPRGIGRPECFMVKKEVQHTIMKM